MTPQLEAYLAHLTPAATEHVRWFDGRVQLRLDTYICAEQPPDEYVTSVRAILLADQSVVVMRNPSGYHILPGGRREAGEALEDALRRELLEETGFAVGAPTMIGVLHFHHLTPKPGNYPYPYPDFLQAVYVAEPRGARSRPPRDKDEYEVEARLQPVAQAAALGLPSGQLALLQQALLTLTPSDGEGDA